MGLQFLDWLRMEQLQLGRWDKTAHPIASHFSRRSRFVDLLGELLISGRWWKCHDSFSLQTMTFSCNLAGLFAKIWVQTFRGRIADSRKGYARLSPVSSLPLGKLVRSCRRGYRYVSYDHIFVCPAIQLFILQIWVFHSFFRGKITSIKNIFGEIPSTYGQLFVARFDFTRSAGAKGGDFRTFDKGNMYRCGRRSWDTLPSSWWRWVEFTFSWADNRHLITCLVHDTSLIYSIW